MEKKKLSDEELKEFLLRAGWFYSEQIPYYNKYPFDVTPKLEYIDIAIETIKEDKLVS